MICIFFTCCYRLRITFLIEKCFPTDPAQKTRNSYIFSKFRLQEVSLTVDLLTILVVFSAFVQKLIIFFPTFIYRHARHVKNGRKRII